MSNIARMMQRATAGAGGAGLDVDEVFSTHLYKGTGSALTINNGIDLSGEGGLVWIKGRTDAYSHYLHDTTTSEPWHFLQTNNTDARNTHTGNEDLTISAFNSNGFVIGSGSGVNNGWGGNNSDFTSWTFRKAPKFFDVVTYTGNGANRTIAHSLDSVPGMIIIKRLDNNNPWCIFHRSTGNTGFINFDTNGFSTVSDFMNNTSPTSTNFALGTRDDVNNSGNTYVAYLFAHNNSDGEFGPSGDQDIIKCGSYTGNGSTPNGPIVNLGFEPQWLLIKNASASANWYIYDTMRGWPVDSSVTTLLRPDTNAAELGGTWAANNITPTGFQIRDDDAHFNTNGSTYVYMAIRRGPLAVPDDATKVFSVNETGTGDSPSNSWSIGFNADMNVHTRTTGEDNYILARLLGTKAQKTNTTDTAGDQGSVKWFNDSSNRINLNTNWFTTNSGLIGWSWKRAPGYFDVVAYTGNNTSGRTVSHNLGVVPEMMWVKRRNVAADWKVYHSALGNTKHLNLNESIAAATDSSIWNDTTPTASVFTLGYDIKVNGNNDTHIAYLFATVDGVSKVGSYTGNGSDNHQIDCGFSSGARFVLIKRTDTSEGWKVHDSVRGIVSGDDPFVELNNTNAENSSFDLVDPYSGGFAVNNYAGWNASGGSYIFYAIA